MNQTIDSTTARRMAEAGTIRGVTIVGQPGGWSVMLKTGLLEKPLGGTKHDRPRMWRSLDTLTAYLRRDLSIVHIDGVYTSHHIAADANRPGRPDAAARLRHAHEAAAYETWLRNQVQASVDDPRPSLPGEEVEARFAKKREVLRRRMAQQQT